MNTITLDRIKYIEIPLKEYDELKKKVASQLRPEKPMSLAEARKYIYNLIDERSEEK